MTGGAASVDGVAAQSTGDHHSLAEPTAGSVPGQSDALTRAAGASASRVGRAAEPQCGQGSEPPGAHPAVWYSGGPGPDTRASQLAQRGTGGPDHTGGGGPVASSCLQSGTRRDRRLCPGPCGESDATLAAFTSGEPDEKRERNDRKRREHRFSLFCLSLYHCLLAHVRCASRGGSVLLIRSVTGTVGAGGTSHCGE